MMASESAVRYGNLTCDGCGQTWYATFEKYAICPFCRLTKEIKGEGYPHPDGKCKYCGRLLDSHPFRTCSWR